jgi:hypothetical protein
LYVTWIETRCTTLRRLASEEPFPDYKTVEGLLEAVEGGDQDAYQQVAKLRATMAEYTEEEQGDISIWAEVFEKVDTQTKSSLRDVTKMVGQMTPEYVMALSKYRQGIVVILKKAWQVGNAPRGTDNKIVKHLDSVIARVLLQLTPDISQEWAPEPLLSGFMLDYVWASMMTVKAGIAEVS